MRLTIIAATGGVGRELLEQAVATGHDVTAVVRDPRKLARPVRTFTADMAAAAGVRRIVAVSAAPVSSPRRSTKPSESPASRSMPPPGIP